MIFPEKKQTSEDVAKHYNELDTFYREFWGEHVHHGLWDSNQKDPQTAVKRLVEYVAEAAAISPGYRVCDIGCGYGATARMLAQLWNIHVCALTISQAQFNYCSSYPHQENNPVYFLRDWLDNDFPSDYFDAAIAIESSEHVEDKSLFFREAFRVLRPDGRLVICAWLAKKDPSLWEVNYLLRPICQEGHLPSMGTMEEYKELMKNAGFQNVYFEDLSKQVKKTWSICLQRVFKAFFNHLSFLKFVFKSESENKIFIKTIFRIWLAYQLGSMQYGLFIAIKEI